MKKLFSWIFKRWVISTLGLAAIALLIWLVGPLIAIADYRPLETEPVRLILIGLVILAHAGKLLWKLFKAKHANARLMEGLLKQGADQGAPENGLEEEELAVLRKRFEDAVTVLKKARLGDKQTKSASTWLAGLSQQWVYELPWYVFIGAPGSGKTTALINSGLQFPLAEQFGPEAIRGVAGTRNCDWWFANDAVLLDTAGRYTTQESNQKADSAAWSGFLQLLKKYRVRRPINGVLLTLSVPDLLEQNAAQREAHVHALRNRLQELHEELNIRFPLYILVTKMDLLAGFMEFFSEFGKEERAQIWGASFPYRDKMQDTDAPIEFAKEFAALEQRINARLIDRLQQERDPQKRAQLYIFPQQLAALKRVLVEFIESLFASSRFTEKSLVRGVYFTSGTQEGSPIDRIMGSLGRALQLEKKLLEPNRPSGKSFFITRLLKDVVFQEAGLAGTNLRWERRRAMLQLAALALAGVITCAVIGAWAISFMHNRAYATAVQARLESVAQQLNALDAVRSTSVVDLLPTLQSVRDLARVPAIYGEKIPFSMGFGLYQGDKLAAASGNAYLRLLHDVFLPRLVMRIEQQLRSGARENPELLYEGLKAYTMLHDPRHFDAAALKAFITADWESSLARDVTNEQRQDLEAHLDTLLASGDASAPNPADAQLIASVRMSIAQTALAKRIYNRLKRQEVGADLPQFTVASAGGPAAPLVFARASGQPLTSGVPGLYSFNGYHKAFLRESDRVAAHLADEEGWVLGLQEKEQRFSDPSMKARLIDDVRRLYLEDYARIWEAFIGDIKLIRATSLQQSIQLARILSAPDSPLPVLLRAIVKEVTLVPMDEADKSVIDKAGDKINSTRENLKKFFGQPERPSPAATIGARPENIVDQRFDDIRRMVRSPVAGQPAPIDATTALINELHTQLTATEAALKGGNTPPPSDLPNKIKAEGSRMPEPIRSLLLTLSAAGTSHALGLTRSNLSQAMKASIGDFCGKAITGRYPFVKNSTRDVTQDDFSRLFSSGGLIDDFFQKNLTQFVNTSTQPWSFRHIGDATMGDASVALLQFQRAQVIREVFFRGSPTASMRLDIKPLTMDASIEQFILDVDGQLIKYSHGPQVPVQVQWPGPRGSTQVRLQLSPPGAAGVSGQTFEGAWALFRMFDQVRIDGTGQPEKFLATFNLDGRKAQFEVLASSVRNPFRLRELEQFQCPDQL